MNQKNLHILQETMKVHYFKNREEAVRKFIGGLALDVGYAERRFVGSSGIGIDIKRDKNIDIVADAQFLPFKDNTFDTIVAGELMEHLPIQPHFC